MANSLLDLSNKVAIVTGAASGIGRATAKLFHTKGAKVIAVDIDYDGLESLKQELDDICSICLSKQKQNDVIRKLPCNHHYHSECIEIWLLQRSNCPICKKEVNISDIFFQC